MQPVDIEAAIIACLTAGIDDEDFEIATKVSNPRPDDCIRVTSIGGNPANLIQSQPRTLIECFGSSETEALDLARLAYALLWAAQNSWLDEDTWVSEISMTDPVNFPDPDTDSARYQFIATSIASLQEV
jgi:hypothetical protein